MINVPDPSPDDVPRLLRRRDHHREASEFFARFTPEGDTADEAEAWRHRALSWLALIFAVQTYIARSDAAVDGVQQLLAGKDIPRC